MQHSWTEIIGFWIVMMGVVGLLVSMRALGASDKAREKVFSRCERWGIPPLVLILMTPASILSSLIGFHLMLIGGGGRYPGYPIDIILEFCRK